MVFPFEKDEQWKDIGHYEFTVEYVENIGYINNPYWTTTGKPIHTPCGYWWKDVEEVVIIIPV